MRKLIIFLSMFLCVIALHARAIQEERRVSDKKAEISYAMGVFIGSQLGLNQFGLEFDYNALAEGIRAIMEDDPAPRLSQNQAMEIVQSAYSEAMERIAAENMLREEEYLAANSRRSGMHVTPNGVQYEIIREGEGDKPEDNSLVRVHYSGTLTDGAVFDESYEEDGAYIPMDMVIPGWSEGVKEMRVGSIYRFYIPSRLAYGSDGIQGYVPPYSTLIFLVELLEIISDQNQYNPYNEYYDYDWEF